MSNNQSKQSKVVALCRGVCAQLIALQSGRCVDLDINTVWNKARVYNRSNHDVGLYTQLTDSSRGTGTRYIAVHAARVCVD